MSNKELTDMVSKRQQLSDMLAEFQNDQNEALAELTEYLGSAAATKFVSKMSEFRERTLPGSTHDQVIGGLLQVIDSVRNIAIQAVAHQAVLVMPREPAPVIEADPAVSADTTEIEADSAVAEDAAVDPDTVELLPDPAVEAE